MLGLGILVLLGLIAVSYAITCFLDVWSNKDE